MPRVSAYVYSEKTKEGLAEISVSTVIKANFTSIYKKL